MKICLVGGIYGKSKQQRSFLRITPETTLENGLRNQGHSVSTFTHYDRIEYSNFDVIHVHHLSFGAVAAAASSSAAPFVFTIHSVTAMNGTLSPVRLKALEFVLSRADAVVALSNTEREFLQLRFQMNDTPVVIRNGIDSETFTFLPRGSALKSARPTLLYVGQLIPLKRVDVLIDAMRQLPKDVELLLVYHNRTLEEQLKLQSQSLGLAERVRFLGPKTPRELASLYQQADLFVLPTSSEALPSVITEAMLCGTPIVATNVGGIGEQIGPFGITVPPGQEIGRASCRERV